MKPRISIVTISYNQATFLEQCIHSVIDQEYPNLEYIIIDGGSTDGSVDIIKKYEDHLAYWVSEKDNGQSHALNKGFSKCTGDLMGWLNSDDYFLPGALDVFAEAYHAQPGAGAWVGDANLVKPGGELIRVQGVGQLDRDGLADWERNGFSQPACLFSRAAWEKAGPIDEGLFIAMDFNLWMNITRDFTFHRIPAILAGCHVHDEAKTQAHVPRMHAEVWTVLYRHGYEDLARKLIEETFTGYDILRGKWKRLTGSWAYKLVQPIVKALKR